MLELNEKWTSGIGNTSCCPRRISVKNMGKQWHNLSPRAGISGKVVDEMAEIWYTKGYPDIGYICIPRKVRRNLSC